MPQLVWFQHDPAETPGTILDWAAARGFACRGFRCDRGEIPRIEDLGADLLVIMGGPQSVHDRQADPWLEQELAVLAQAYEAKVPMLGICLGCQLLAAALGGNTRSATQAEIGWFPVKLNPQLAGWAISAGLPMEFEPLHWHGDTFDVPPTAVELARSEAGFSQGFLIPGRVLAMQFHLEATAAMVADWQVPDSPKWHAGPFCQSPDQVLARSPRFAETRRHLSSLLDAFFGFHPNLG